MGPPLQKKIHREVKLKTKLCFLLTILLLLFTSSLWAIEGPKEAEKPFFLRELLVTATRTLQTIEDVPASSTIISEEEIKATNPRDLGEALRGTLGVDIRSYGPLGSAGSVSLRASTPSQVLVLVDGRPMNILSLGQADLSTIPVSAIDHIEVVRGPGSNLYGANALGGVINVITKDPDKLTARVTGDFGVYTHSQFIEDRGLYTHDRHYGDGLNISLEHGVTIAALGLPTDYGNVGYYVTVDHRNTSGFRDNSDYEGNDVTLKLKYDYKNLFIARLFFGYHGDDLGAPGEEPDPHQPAPKYGNREVNSLFNRQKDENYFWDFTTEIHPHKTLTLRTRFYRNEFDNRFFSVFDDFDMSTFTFFKAEAEYRTINTTLGGGLQADWDPVTWFSASGGVEGKTDQFSTESQEDNTITKKRVARSRLEEDANSMGYWVQLRLIPIKSLILQSGVRYDHLSIVHSRFGTEASPNWGLVWKLNDWNILKVNVGRAYRAPTLNDRFFPETAFTAPNPKIKPERGWSAELGYEVNPWRFLWVRLGSYYRDVKNMIQYGPFGPDGKFMPENIGRVTIVGAEAEMRLEILKYFTLGANYAYTFAQQYNREVTSISPFFTPATFGQRRRDAVLIPKHRGGFLAMADTKDPLYWTRVSLDGQMASGRPFYYSSFNPGPTHVQKKTLPAYYTLNLKVTQGLGRFVETFFAVDNMTNTAWREAPGSSFGSRDFPMPGRRFTGGLTVKY
jgi:outer membrane cobalamin receptor